MFYVDFLQLIAQAEIVAVAAELDTKFKETTLENKKNFSNLRGAIDSLRCFVSTQQDPVVTVLITRSIHLAEHLENHFFGLQHTLADASSSVAS